MPHSCWHCGGAIEPSHFYRQDTCSSCRRDTHACKNCEHFDLAYNNQCRESSADRVVDKEKANFCDYFKPSTRAGGSSASADALKAAAAALFRKK
jgi:hypothetical protein